MQATPLQLPSSLSMNEREENQEILAATLDAARDLFSTLAIVATFLAALEATIISFILSVPQTSRSWEAAVILAYMTILGSMVIAMLSALLGVFCSRERMLVPFQVSSVTKTGIDLSVHNGPLGMTAHFGRDGDTKYRKTESVVISVFLRVIGASEGLVASLSVCFLLSVVSVILYMWSSHSLSTSISVTTFLGLILLFLVLRNNIYFVSPGFIVPPGTPEQMTAYTGLAMKMDLPFIPTMSFYHRTAKTIHFFSSLSKPRLHKDTHIHPSNARGHAHFHAHVSTGIGDVRSSISFEREQASTTSNAKSHEHGHGHISTVFGRVGLSTSFEREQASITSNAKSHGHISTVFGGVGLSTSFEREQAVTFATAP